MSYLLATHFSVWKRKKERKKEKKTVQYDIWVTNDFQMCMKDLVWQDTFRILHYHSLLVCFSSSPHNFANCRYQVYVLKDVEEILVFLNLKEQTKKIVPLAETPLQIASTDILKIKLHLIWSTDAWWHILPDVYDSYSTAPWLPIVIYRPDL